MGRIVFVIICGAIAAVCIYMASIVSQANGMRNAWLFIAFAFLFGLPAVAALVDMIRRYRTDGSFNSPVKKTPESVRFVPHWQMMSMIGAALLAIALAILLSLFK